MGDSPEEKRKNPWPLRIIILLCFVVLGLSLFLFGAWHVPDNRQWAESERNRVEDRVREIAAIPHEENPYYKYVRAVEAYAPVEHTVRGMGLPPPDMSSITGSSIPGEYVPVFIEHQKANSESIKLVMEAYPLEKGFAVVSHKTFEEKTIDLLGIRDLAQFITILGMIQERDGNIKKAVHHYFAVIKMGNTIGSGGNLIHGMMAVALNSIALDPLISIGGRNDLDGDMYAHILDELDRLDQGCFTYRELVDMEFLIFENVFESIRAGNTKILKVDLPWGARFLQGSFFAREQRIFQNYHKDLVENLPEHYPHGGWTFPEPVFPPLSYVAPIVVPNHNRAFEVYIMMRARIDGLKTLLALQLYRVDHGDFPQHLNELVPRYLPSLPADPFSGDGDFVYINQDGRVALYSVGPDGIDGGGRINAVASSDRRGDIIIYPAGKEPEDENPKGKVERIPRKR